MFIKGLKINMENNRCPGGNGCTNIGNHDTGNAVCPDFFSIPPVPFALLSSLIGALLIDNLNLNQQNSLGNFLVGVGQILLTAAAQGSTLESGSKQNQQIQQLSMIKKQICELEQQMNC
jgi:hypothetical protein